MSSGVFSSTFYTSDSGNVYPIKVQPETLTFSEQGTPATAGDQEVSAIAYGSRRQKGVIARKVRLKWTGAAPDGYDPNGIVSVIILTQAAYTAINKEDTVTYLGTAARVLGKTPEYVN